PFLNFSERDNALAELDKSAAHYARSARTISSAATAPSALELVNTRLVQAERTLSNDAGLPRRPWFKNLIYAPGFYTGYGAKTLPGIREGIEQRRYDEARHEIER